MPLLDGVFNACAACPDKIVCEANRECFRIVTRTNELIETVGLDRAEAFVRARSEVAGGFKDA